MFALAIGAAAGVFSIVDHVLLRSLPVTDPDGVVVIWTQERAGTTVSEISHWAYRSWRESARSFDGLAAIGSVNFPLVLRDRGEPETLPVAGVSASFFPLLGTAPILGRTLLPEDDEQGAPRVAVLSYGSWVRRFRSDPAIVGRWLTLGGAGYTVVGVMPAGFEYPYAPEMWVALVPQLVDAGKQWNVDALEVPSWGMLFVLGRLAPGVSVDTARAELTAFVERQSTTAFRPGMTAVLTPLRDHLFGRTRPALLALAAAVGLVLVIACANVATLLLVRASGLSQQTAVRLALGAGRWRIVRQSLMEALALSAIGGVLGLVIARWMAAGLVVLAPPDVPGLGRVALDARTFAFAWIACAVAAVLAGLAPGLHASRWNVVDVLKSGNARLTRSRRLRRGFVAGQIAIALSLLVGAGLVGRSFANLLNLDLGFDPTNVVTLDVEIPDAAAERQNAFHASLLERVRAMPGVSAAGAIYQRPLEHAGIGTDATIVIEGQSTNLADRPWEQNPRTNYQTVTPDYFRTTGIRVLRGRDFAETDTGMPRVYIVSERLAHRLWPGQDPIGKRLAGPGTALDAQGQPVWSTLVGVVEDAHYRGLTDVRFDLYSPYRQARTMAVKHLMVRGSANLQSLVAAIRAEARRLEPTSLVEGATTMEAMVSGAVAPWRFGAVTLTILSAFALLLAALGIYGTISQSVVERRREIAVRMAVGGVGRDVIRLVFREGMTMTIVGVVVGLVAAVVVGRAVAGLLFGVAPIDAATMTAMAALFVIVSGVALLLPAWRATAVDPATVLKQD